MITLNRADLDFLYRQVTVNYLKPDPSNPGQFIPTNVFNYSALANAVDPSGVREVAGSNNNLVGGHWNPAANGGQGAWVSGPNNHWGEASQPFLNVAVGQSVTSAPDPAYNKPHSPVTDADPRLISSLVSTMYTSGPFANPAAADAATNGGANAQFDNLTVNGLSTAFVANAGVLGGGRYNELFVSFGQFFDHGLDLVNRDPNPNATVTVILSPNDPLYDADGPNNIAGDFDDVTSIRVRRADVANAGQAGGDGVFGTSDDALHSAGFDSVLGTADDIYSRPIYTNQTGLLIDQSQTYGSHQSVNALLREYDSSGHPTGRVVAGNTAAGPAVSDGLATWADVKANALRIGAQLQDSDIHNAPVLRVDPAGKLMFAPDGGPAWSTSGAVTGPQAADDPFMRNPDGTVMRTAQDMLFDFNPGISLNAHIITGDGRGNENIGLTSVHHIFHEEHNAEANNIRQSILNSGDAAFIAKWQTSPGVWDGEKLYQAARLITESEYNHIAIDQYVGTLYAALPEFVSYSSDINPGVSLEFSQAVFRLGHSMLTETINVTDPNTGQDLRLVDMFLNPTLYQQMLDGGGNPSDLTKGLVSTLGNEVDEFVTPALQQMLLGQPLDLAAINITRGREVGLPTWMEFRDQVSKQLIQNTNNTNGSALAPYDHWADVLDHLKSPLTGVNLIAAYAHDGGAFDWGIDEARDAYTAGTGTLQEIRDKAQVLYDAYLDAGDPNHAAALTFMEGTATYAGGQWTFVGSDRGFWDIDLWIGGLAERPLFDGPLGTTFSYVILDFAQREQDGDRFYYLFRTPMGTNLGNEIIENQFSNLVMEHTGLSHLNGEVFIWPNKTFELGAGNDHFNAATQTVYDVDGTPMAATGGHLIIAGNGGNDYIVAGLGDDTVYGDGGDDQIATSQGNDHAFGGAGNDTISDDENDDFLSGGAGNDLIFAGPGGLDTIFGDEGDDELHGGDGIDEVLGGPGNDILYGDGDTDVIFGDDGDDYVDGGDSVDEIQGQAGNDWLRGGVGDDHLMGGDGNDLLEGGLGPTANDGDRLLGQGVLDFAPTATPDEDVGFDVVSYEDVDIAITANLETSNQNGAGGLLDTYVGMDGLVGSRFADDLTGAAPNNVAGNGVNNLLAGGAGNDLLTGLGGDDLVFGDKVTVKNDLSVYLGPASGYVVKANWKGTGEDRPDFGATGGLGHFLGDNGPAGTADKAVFSGDLADYAITFNSDGTIRVVDTRGIDSTPIGDLVKDVEVFQFATGTWTVTQLAGDAPIDINWNPVTPGAGLPGNGQIATLTTVDPDDLTGFTYQLVSQTSPNGSFAVGAATGAVTRSGGALTNNATYVLNLRTTDPGAHSFNETIRILTGDGSGNVLNGNAGDDVVYALGGGDTLNGLAGDDNLFGQDGNDVLDGGAGYNLLDGGAGTDTASYAGAGGGVHVSLAIAGQQITGGAGVDTLVSIQNLTGGAFNDSLTGDGAANVLNGGGGADTLNGGLGSDTMNGGAGDDVAYVNATGDSVVEAAGGGADTIRSTLSGTYTMGANLEDFEQIATSAVTVNGNGLNNQITGNNGADVLNGGAGADTVTGGGGGDRLLGSDGNDLLSGGASVDTLTGGNNDDILDGGSGADRLDGGSGLDAASYQSAAAAVRVDLVSPSANTGEASGDVFVSVENLTGSDFGDELKGNNSANVLVGRAGNDVISAGGNSDRLKGGEGADTLQGQGGNDSLEGEAGDDLMSGGASARDYFVFHEYGLDPATRSWGHDVISDFEDGVDLLDFRNSGAYGAPITFASLTITQQGSNTLIVGPHDGESILLLNRPVATVTAGDFIFV